VSVWRGVTKPHILIELKYMPNFSASVPASRLNQSFEFVVQHLMLHELLITLIKLLVPNSGRYLKRTD
jgi:hypothetical protein